MDGVRPSGTIYIMEAMGSKLTDPNFVEQTYVAAGGLGKSFNITKGLKGSAQTLYHFYWNGSDPYKSKILIRMAIDFSLKKKEVKAMGQEIQRAEKCRTEREIYHACDQ